MTVGVLVAMSDRWESAVVTALDRSPDLRVVRRCADLADLLAAAAAGLAAICVVSADLRLLDRSAMAQLGDLGLPVVGVHPPGDGAAERRLQQLGALATVPVDAPAELLWARLLETSAAGGSADAQQRTKGAGGTEEQAPVGGAAGARRTSASAAPPSQGRAGSAGRGRRRPRDPALDEAPSSVRTTSGRPSTPSIAALPSLAGADQRRSATGHAARSQGSLGGPPEPQAGPGGDESEERGQILAVWGPAGAPGRTTVAVNLAAELAAGGSSVVLVDADTYGGCVAQVLSLLDEAPGIAAATRAAEHGTLDLEALARLAPEVAPGLRVLTGIPKAERWTEVRAAALEQVLRLTRRLARWTVVDCGFSIEDDEELSYDTVAPRRNAATLTTLAAADRLLAIGAADPIGLQRLVRALQELGTVPSPRPLVVVNKVRAGAVGKDPERRIGEALARFAGVDDLRFLPADPGTMDAVLLAGRSLAEGATHSLLRQAFARLAAELDAAEPGLAGAAPRGRRARRRG